MLPNKAIIVFLSLLVLLIGTTGTCSALEENIPGTTTVLNVPPMCEITAPKDKVWVTVNTGVTFSGEAYDPNGVSEVTCHWDFADGGTADTISGTHVWTSLGAFNVTLTVSDGVENFQDQVTVYVQRATTGGGPSIPPEEEPPTEMEALGNILLVPLVSFAGFDVTLWMAFGVILILGLISDQLGIVTATIFITGFCYVFSDRLWAIFGETPTIAGPAAGTNILLLPVANLMGINIMLGVILAGMALVAYWQKQYGILTMTIVVSGLLFMLSDQLIAAIV